MSKSSGEELKPCPFCCLKEQADTWMRHLQAAEVERDRYEKALQEIETRADLFLGFPEDELGFNEKLLARFCKKQTQQALKEQHEQE